METKKFIILILVITVVFFAIVSWNHNQASARQQNYQISQQENCYKLGSKEKEKLPPKESVTDDGLPLFVSGSFAYAPDKDECVFETVTTVLSNKGSIVNYTLEGLFSGNHIGTTSLSLNDADKPIEKQKCEYYNGIRLMYFNKGISCML